MYLKTLYLKNFRNYKEASFTFSPSYNVIFGKNAQGKTSLLEAISVLTTGKSFKAHHLFEMIQEGKDFFYLQAEIVRDGISQTCKIYYDKSVKKVQIDATTHQTLTPLLGVCPSVLFTPEDLSLITQSPMYRRRFLNLHLGQSDPLYVHYLFRFVRAMKQRNSLLKMRKTDSFDCWEVEMAFSANYLQRKRQELINEMNSSFRERSQKLSEKADDVYLQFHTPYPSDSQKYQMLLQNMREKEFYLGTTQQGPHRDDLYFLIQKKQAKFFASEGQKKTMVAALRLSEWHELKKKTSCFPLMAIDDFASTLDEDRSIRLFSQLNEMKQVFLTMPQILNFLPKEKILHIHQGNCIETAP